MASFTQFILSNIHAIHQGGGTSIFSKVQFIGVALCTTPAGLTSIENTSDDGYYAGLPSDKDDLTARVALIRQAIQSAYLSPEVEQSNETLKIFVLPEFFMRGVQGAYYSPQIYSAEAILIREFKKALQELADSGIEVGRDSLFVLGTILSTNSKIDYTIEPEVSLFQTGDHLLDLYYRLHPTEKCGRSSFHPQGKRIRNFLEILDGKFESGLTDQMKFTAEEGSDEAYLDILKKTLEYCDERASLEIRNRCLIISGTDLLSCGTEALCDSVYEPIIVQKQFKSKEDFILNNLNNNQVTTLPKYLQTTTKYCELDNLDGETKQYPSDGRAIFEYEGLRIGIDICLDHSRQRLVKHLYTHPNDYLDLQIVTSCGMSVRNTSVIARTEGIVFNCDGEYELQDTKSGVDGNGCHTSLQRVKQQMKVCGKEILNGAVLSNAYPLKAEISCKIPEDKPLYRFPDFHIHIYEPLGLKK